METRKVKRSFYNSSCDMVVIDITSMPCPPSSHAAQKVLLDLFGEINGNPSLLDCEGRFADTVQIRHSGTAWVITAQAIVPRTEFPK